MPKMQKAANSGQGHWSLMTWAMIALNKHRLTVAAQPRQFLQVAGPLWRLFGDLGLALIVYGHVTHSSHVWRLFGDLGLALTVYGHVTHSNHL